MSWFTNTFKTSIGKKLIMAVTGLSFICFLMAHLAGNLTLYGGENAFNSYVERLHTFGPVITIVELGLLFLVITHVLTGSILFYQNILARPIRYKVYKSAGGRSLGSATMPYSGFIILAFIIFHLINFHFADKTGTTIFQIVAKAFANPLYIVIYIAAMIVLAIHISHAFWSLFQTIGADHPKYTPLIRIAGIVISLIFGVGFGFLPVYVSLI
ncbi:MAG: succinate dehydrogenase cytochrome b subunit [Desulfobacteraceae bacterium]|nr:succinate dehydrogenase cytochrome b subunit [Desulfobacteraceae bacterium]